MMVILNVLRLCTRCSEGNDPELFISPPYILVAIKASLLKFNMFNIYKINISNFFTVFFSKFKIVDLIQILLTLQKK